MTITPEDLARWKALADAASPGPWAADTFNALKDADGRALLYTDRDGEYISFEREADGDLMQESRTALPALIAEVERLRAQVSASHPEETDAGRIVYLPPRPLGMLHPVDTPSGTVTFKVAHRDVFCGPPEAPHTFRVRWFAWEQVP